MLLCIEMAIFAVMHTYAFSYKDYRISKAAAHYEGNHYQGGFLGWKAFMDAYNPWDIISAIGRSFRWLFVGRRTRLDDISYDQHRPDSMSLQSTRKRSDTEYGGARSTKDFASAVGIAPKRGKYQSLQDIDSTDPFADHQNLISRDTTDASPFADASLPATSIDLGDGNDRQEWDDDHLTVSDSAPRVGEVIPPTPERRSYASSSASPRPS
jgi:hypothetical protein